MGRYPQKANGKGSLKWTQKLINERPDLLDEQIKKIFRLNQSEGIEWVSPLKEDKYAEYRDEHFLKRLGITLDKTDRLIGTAISSGKHEILLATKSGKSLRFSEKQIRDMGRAARGVRGIKLGKGDIVVSMQVFPSDIGKTGSTLLTVTELGFAKRSDFNDYRGNN